MCVIRQDKTHTHTECKREDPHPIPLSLSRVTGDKWQCPRVSLRGEAALETKITLHNLKLTRAASRAINNALGSLVVGEEKGGEKHTQYKAKRAAPYIKGSSSPLVRVGGLGYRWTSYCSYQPSKELKGWDSPHQKSSVLLAYIHIELVCASSP